jgi:hypothetical protein
MRIIITKIFLLLICLSLFSCKKKIEDNYRPEFIGDWYCPAYNIYVCRITVDNNSNAVYHERPYGGSGESTFKGKARANDKHFKIGRFHSFKIIDYPHKIDTALNNTLWVPDTHTGHPKRPNWVMTLDGPLFYMGSGTYYKADY